MSLWHDPLSGKDVWVLDAESVRDWPDTPPWSSDGFCLLFAADHVVDVEPLARRALDQGLAFACAWGPGCAMIEDAFDEAIVGDARHEETAKDVVLTSSHADESLHEALEFFVEVATPAPAREASCRAWVVFPIGATFRARVEKALHRRGAQRRG